MKYTYFYKILIVCTLYKNISNTIGSINLDSKIRQSKNMNEYWKSSKVRKAYLDYEKLIERIKKHDISGCRLFNLTVNYIVNSVNKSPKKFYFIELQIESDFHYFFYEKKEQNDFLNINCTEIRISYGDSQSRNFTDYYLDIKHLDEYLNFFNESRQIKDIFTPLNDDPCYQVSLSEYFNKILENNKIDLLVNEVKLCDDGCDFLGLEIQKLEINCYCPVKMDVGKMSVMNQIINYFTYFENFKVLYCYKLFFNINGQQNNYLSEIILLLLIINIICIAYTLYSVYTKKYYKLLLFFSNYMGKIIYDFKRVKNLNSKNLYLETLTDEQDIIINDLCFYLMNINKEKNKNKEKVSDFNLSKKNNVIIIEEEINEIISLKEKIIKMLNKGQLNDYYNCLIHLFPQDNYDKYLIEDEINNLDYDEYRKIEKRNYLEIVWSIFKTNYDFSSTFLIFENKDYKIYTVKIITYINTLLLSLDLNISFYNDDTMRKIYIDSSDNNNLVNRLPILLLTNSISLIPSILFELIFSSYQDYFIELKSNMNNDTTDNINNIKNYYKKLLIRIISCCIFSFIFDVISWYYISCFFAVYLDTQKAIFLDFLREFLLSIISILLLSLIYSLIKKSIIKNESKNKICEKIKFTIILIMNQFWFIIIFSLVLQLIISIVVLGFIKI